MNPTPFLTSRRPFTVARSALSFTALLLIITAGSTLAEEEPSLGVGVEDVSKIIPSLQEGDMVFVQSHTRQAQTLTILTGSRMTHCGILFKENGKWVVHEGAGANSDVHKTLADWRAHELHNPNHEPADLHIYVRRLKQDKPLSQDQIDNLKKVSAKLHHSSYDRKFAWEDKYIYCSELLYKAYQNALSISLLETLPTYKDLLAKPETMPRLNAVQGEVGQQIRDYFLSPALKKDDPVVSPGDLVHSKKLTPVVPPTTP